MPITRLSPLKAARGLGLANHAILNAANEEVVASIPTRPDSEHTWLLTQVMAAAPELLAAAREALVLLAELEGELPELKYTIRAVRDPLQRALAKAEGRPT